MLSEQDLQRRESIFLLAVWIECYKIFLQFTKIEYLELSANLFIITIKEYFNAM